MGSCLSFHAASHTGLVHTTNEDSFSIREMKDGGVLLLICDGMGGMGQGDVASRLAVEQILGCLESSAGDPAGRMRDAIIQSDRIIRERLCNQGQGLPGSTAVMIYVLEGIAYAAWVGDSRAYWLRRGEVVERTRDHKLIDEFIQHGDMTEEEAKRSPMAHVITRALGGKTVREPAVRPASLHGWSLQHGDELVLCSDGVCDLLSDQEVAESIVDNSLEQTTADIVQLALDRGGHDNTTVICARWQGDNAKVQPTPSPTPLMVGGRLDSPNNDGPNEGRRETFIAVGVVLTTLGLLILYFS